MADRTVRVRRSRTGTRAHTRHLYRGRGTQKRELAAFEREYGTKKGRYVYGATVGKVKREREAQRRR